MPVPEPGRYGVVRTPGLIGWLIRQATHSWANHAFVVGADGTVIEADPRGGVRVAPLAQYAGMRMAVNSGEPMTDAQRAAVLAQAEAMVGYRYGLVDIGALALSSVGLSWRWLFKLIGLDRRAVICSQLVADCGKAAGLDWQCSKEFCDEVTPGLLAARPGMQPYVVAAVPTEGALR